MAFWEFYQNVNNYNLNQAKENYFHYEITQYV